MAHPLRKTGIAAVGDLAWGAHFCQFYESKDDLLDILIPYFRAGLENEERCLWVTHSPVDVVDAATALRRAIPEADHYLESEAIRIIACEDWYFKNGQCDLLEAIRGWEGELNRALVEGYVGLRANGSAAWVHGKLWTHFPNYEHKLNALFAGLNILILCTYPLSTPDDLSLDVAAAHQFALSKHEGQWAMHQIPVLEQRNAQLTEQSAKLENRVKERTLELASSNEQLRGLSARFQSEREAEGRRIAREIHDELGSTLTSLKWDLDWLLKNGAGASGAKASVKIRERIEAMKELTDSTVRAMRRVASELRPSVLDDLGLVEALEWQAQQFQERTGIACHFDSSIETAGLGSEQSTVVFRIFQEALTNILRHAEASRVLVKTERRPGEFVLIVQDNGKGITDAERDNSSSLGLLGMRERARLVAGRLDLRRGDEGGTLLTLRVPVAQEAAQAEAGPATELKEPFT